VGNGLHRAIAAGALAAVAAFTAPALAQDAMEHANSPFFENLLYHNQVYGIEMVGQRLKMAEAFRPPVPKDLVPQLQRMERRDFARFRGTLAQRQPALEGNLAAALRAVMAAVEAGKPVTAEVAKARALLDEAAKIVVDQKMKDAPANKAAVLANLLVANDGVAEAFEDSIREIWGFPNGWAAVRRVEVLWAELTPLARPEQRDEAAGILDLLKTSFYPRPEPKIPFPKEEAEDVEALAHQLLSIIEAVTDSTLYMGRDFAKLSTYLAEVTTLACQAYARGQDLIGAEGIHAVLDPYRVNLAGALDLIAPELRKQATLVFPRLVEVEYDFYEGFENVPPDTRPLSNAQLCGELVTVFTEAQKVLKQ